ncbi:hypothetical protein PV08_00548 [Exophiala spinifera]|uniref:Uncharacterized protein n=1 Tax=Exophiala spinifera TaxID=91928 RepID=A0A0D2BM29_9EURO|nr:uncharacterized protein PV08_00548 [Exophiala spinifera]KIW19973.1 hypothetical protein PV08_00548 [Exophiala spinifera]
MDGVSVASGIAGLITLALQVSGAIAIYVTSIKDRAKNIEELHNELLLLSEVLSRLRDFLTSERAKGRAFDTNSVLQKAISDCRDRIERIGEKLKPLEGGPISRAIDKLKWPFEQREVNYLIDNLRRYGQTFHFAVTVEGCDLLARTSEDAAKGLQEMLEVSRKITELSAQMGLSNEEAAKRAAQIQEIIALIPMLTSTALDVTELTHAARMAELREQERRTTDILDWLAPVSWLHKHRDLQLRRSEGTGVWFLQHRDFLAWVQADTVEHDLLCVGGPGAGKSILCSLIVDHLRSTFKDPNVAVAYYYYDYSDQQSQNPINLARAVLRQLSMNGNSVPSAVAEFYQRTRNDVKDQTWFHDLLSIIRRVAATYTQSFVIIDALDEADIKSQHAGLFEVLDALRDSGRAKILATARSHVLNNTMRFNNPVMVDIIANSHDIRLFLARTIEERPDMADVLDSKLKEQILETLSQKANGMFLLPAMQIRTILDQVTKADVRRSLTHLSSNLTEAFQSTIRRITSLPAARKDLAFKALMWISHARRPLRATELQQAMAMRLDDDDLDLDNVASVRTIVDCCCGLVQVDSESSIIRLVHHSLEEYLREHDHGLFDDASRAITKICLKFLALDYAKQLPFKNRHNFHEALDLLPFLEYAATEWGFHASNVPIAEFRHQATAVLNDSLALIAIARIRDRHSFDFRKWKEKAWHWAYSGGAGISIVATFGLADLLEILVNENKQNLCLDARDVYGSTPLHEAAMQGHDRVAEILIGHGAQLLDRNYGSATPLYLAVAYGRLSTVKFLLGFDHAQVNTPGPRGLTPLHKATEQGNVDIVTMLLQAGAVVATQDNFGMTALHLAARRGYLSLVRLLGVAGRAVGVQDKDGLCALDHAATGGYTAIVRYLLENGGNMWHKGHEAWTPLHRACRGGHTDIVSLFLEHDADVFAADRKGNIPLHLAVRSGNMSTVRALLDHDPQLKREQLFARDRKGSTPRLVAFFTAHYDMHKYLRAEEWALLGTEPSDANILTNAIERGDLEAVRVHLTNNPDGLNQCDENGQPPLHVSLQENQRDIVNFLLESGASIESVGFHGWRPLHIAASLGNLELVEVCLQHGADVKSRTRTRQTPMHKAASSRSASVVRRLIEAGADPNDRNDRGMTALHVAAHQNDIQIVRLLVNEHGMDVLAKDFMKLTAATWAERSGHLEVLAFLRREAKKVKSAARVVADRQEDTLPSSTFGLQMMHLPDTSIEDDIEEIEIEGEMDALLVSTEVSA